MINILIAESYIDQVDSRTLERTAQAVLDHQSMSENDLSLVIEDDAHLHDLNKSFLGVDAPTDVLSFPAGEDEVDPDSNRPYLGDVIISYPRAVEQSSAAGHTAGAEIQLLIVHGVLHLLGYDHADVEEKEEMWSVQREILTQLDVPLSRLPD